MKLGPRFQERTTPVLLLCFGLFLCRDHNCTRFKSFVADGMVLVAGDRIRLDAALQVGTTSESVEVTTQPRPSTRAVPSWKCGRQSGMAGPSLNGGRL